MDDSVFFNPNTILPITIQSFLDSKVPICDTWHAGSGSNQPPFTCLKDYRQETPNKWAEPGLCGDFQGGNKSSAEIIYYVAQSCGINPKVLIVMLEKEQSLITDSWPWNIQYRSAMGFGCPDTAPCDAEYYGFFNQVYNAARQFKRYARDSASFRYRAYRDNYVQYNPNPGCGGTNLYIRNQATAGLYNYTPYQPNASALNNLYGGGDSCGAYGNRNFWRLYTDWFGGTFGDPYYAQHQSQSGYPTLYTGQNTTAFIQYRNMGNARWYDDTNVPSGGSPTHLAATTPINRSSVFSATWPSPGRPNVTFSKVFEADGTTLAVNQHAVEPGQIARFEFTISASANLAPGVYREHFQPVLEGSSSWSMGGMSWLDVTVLNPYKATFHSQSGYPTLVQNTTTQSYIQYKNTGVKDWYDDLTSPTNNNAPPIRLATTAPINRASGFGSTWPTTNRLSTLFSMVYEADGITPSNVQHLVQPGQIARFEFKFTAGADLAPGVYREQFQPLVEGSSNWNIGGVAWYDVGVAPRAGKAQYFLQSAYPTTARGQANPSFISYKNATNFPWYDSASKPVGILPVHLASTFNINRLSVFSWGWITQNRPNITFSKVYEADGTTLASNQNIVQPGQIGKFEFKLTPPWNINSGTHREYFQPLVEGAQVWGISGLAWLDVTVTP